MSVEAAVSTPVYKHKAVLQITSDGRICKARESATEAAQTLGVAPSGISQCCTRKNATYRGYIWRFQETDGEEVAHEELASNRTNNTEWVESPAIASVPNQPRGGRPKGTGERRVVRPEAVHQRTNPRLREDADSGQPKSRCACCVAHGRRLHGWTPDGVQHYPSERGEDGLRAGEPIVRQPSRSAAKSPAQTGARRDEGRSGRSSGCHLLVGTRGGQEELHQSKRHLGQMYG